MTMRKTLLLAAAIALLPLTPAAAQRGARVAAAVPKLELTAGQRAELQQAVSRGRALAVLDQASRVASKDMLARVTDPAGAGIAGWIAQPEGNGVTVTFYAKEGDGFVAVYRTQILAGRATGSQLLAAGERTALTGPAARMAAARTAAEAIEQQPCGTDFNALVLPPQGEGPVLVYRMSPRMAANKLPTGGHYRISVGDGAAESVSLGGACADLALPAVAAGQRPRPLQVLAPRAALPNELHVFLALWARRPLVVATGAQPVRLWGVTGEGIAELQQ